MSDPHATLKNTGRNPGVYDVVLYADAAGRDTHDPKGQQLIEAAVERENMLFVSLLDEVLKFQCGL